jgi:hypothetical protein
MSLLVSRVPRALENKTKMFGFELGDLLLIFLYLAISNLIFGSTSLKFVMVWMGTLGVATLLYFSKRNKPDQYLQHWGEYTRSPGVFSAGKMDTEYQPYLFKNPEEDFS